MSVTKEVTAVEWLEEQINKQQQSYILLAKGSKSLKKGVEAILTATTLLKMKCTQAKEMENKKAHEYAEFAIRCDRKGMKILNFEDWIKL